MEDVETVRIAGINYLRGGIMAVMAGALTALSMVMQHAALRHATPKMSFSFRGRALLTVHKNVFWLAGLVLYGIATGVLYSFAGLWIPLSMLAGLFLTMLAFNLFFSRLFLGEVLTKPKVAGAFTVLVGASLSALGTSLGEPGVPTTYTSDEVARLFAAPAGAIYFALLLFSVFSTLAVILVHERKYPFVNGAISNQPPARLERAMGVLYPASLGLDEAIAHLTLRCMNAMLTQCNRGGCLNPVFPVTITLWILSSAGTVIWLRIVFKRFSSTTALPIEYGAASAADVLSGIIFFQEYKYYELWRYPLIIGGVVLCLLGIQLGRMHVTEDEVVGASAPAQAAHEIKSAEAARDAEAGSEMSGMPHANVNTSHVDEEVPPLEAATIALEAAPASACRPRLLPKLNPTADAAEGGAEHDPSGSVRQS